MTKFERAILEEALRDENREFVVEISKNHARLEICRSLAARGILLEEDYNPDIGWLFQMTTAGFVMILNVHRQEELTKENADDT